MPASYQVCYETMSEDSPLRARALQSQDAVELPIRQVAHHTFASPHSRTATDQHLAEGHFGNFPKVLTETLCGMERDGLISRKLYPNVPPRVEYHRARREFDARKKKSP